MNKPPSYPLHHIHIANTKVMICIALQKLRHTVGYGTHSSRMSVLKIQILQNPLKIFLQYGYNESQN